MPKTTPLTEGAHKRIKDAQDILRDRYKIKMTFQDIISRLVPDDPEEIVKRVIDYLKR